MSLRENAGFRLQAFPAAGPDPLRADLSGAGELCYNENRMYFLIRRRRTICP